MRSSKYSGLYKRQYKLWAAIFRKECRRLQGPFVQRHALMVFERHEDGSTSLTPIFGVIGS